jgi:hypothetical protein
MSIATVHLALQEVSEGDAGQRCAHEMDSIQGRQPEHQSTALIKAARSSAVTVPWYPQTEER